LLFENWQTLEELCLTSEDFQFRVLDRDTDRLSHREHFDGFPLEMQEDNFKGLEDLIDRMRNQNTKIEEKL